MAKKQYTPSNRTRQCLDDLEGYLYFCQRNGYKFNEADLYNMRSFSYQQYSKKQAGKWYKDQWEADARRYGCWI
jgi:hypothetical protein